MSKNKKQHSDDIKGEELDVNGNPVDLNREYIGSKIKVPMASPNSSIYKTRATIIFRGKPIMLDKKKKEDSLDFLSGASISFQEE